MSEKHRCETCDHRPGLRNLGPTLEATQDVKRTVAGTKKKACGCRCHQ